MYLTFTLTLTLSRQGRTFRPKVRLEAVHLLQCKSTEVKYLKLRLSEVFRCDSKGTNRGDSFWKFGKYFLFYKPGFEAKNVSIM